MIIKIKEYIKGDFAENKDIAREIRLNKIIPALNVQENVVLNFEGINAATQSFVHALLSDIIRHYGSDILDRINFDGCTEEVKKMIVIVTEYMQLAK